MRKISTIGSLIISIILVYGIFHLTEIGCPILFLTGIPCAGCGMTRAWFWALQGEVLKAFYYHPLFWSVPFILLFLGFSSDLSPKSCKKICTVIIVGYLVVYFIRLCLPSDSLLSIDINRGFVIRCIRKVLQYIGG